MKSRTPRLLFGSAMIMALLLLALLPTPSPSLAPAGSNPPSTLDAIVPDLDPQPRALHA